MSKVILRKVTEYDLDKLTDLFENELPKLDKNNDLGNIIKKDSNVFIKLNMVNLTSPDTGIITHPVILESIVRVVKKYTDNIIVGDNPATRDIHSCLKKAKMMEIIEKYNLKIINPEDRITIKNPNYKLYQSFNVSREIIESDLIINLPKVKTHSLAYMTVAEKNFFGVIFGLEKAGWHSKAPNAYDFGQAINDLYEAIILNHHGPILNIADGIIGLEGEGPGASGITKKSDLLLMSMDAISLDKVACLACHLDLNRLFITNIAIERNLGGQNIAIDGSLDEFKDLSFLPPKETMTNKGLKLMRLKVFRNILLEHPVVDHEKCIRCGECVKICPAHTMKIIKNKNNSYPNMTKKNCIRCWCCSEVCPQSAISKSKRPLIGKIVFKVRL